MCVCGTWGQRGGGLIFDKGETQLKGLGNLKVRVARHREREVLQPGEPWEGAEGSARLPSGRKGRRRMVEG